MTKIIMVFIALTTLSYPLLGQHSVPLESTKIVGGDEQFDADVYPLSGKKVLATGILGGTVTIDRIIPQAVSNIFIDRFKDTSGSEDLHIDGSSVAVNFSILCSPTHDRFIEEIRFISACEKIKLKSFLCNEKKNEEGKRIDNGVQISYFVDGVQTEIANIRSTSDFRNFFSFSSLGVGAAFDIESQSDDDEMISSMMFNTPIKIKKCGTIPPILKDSLQVTVRDDLKKTTDYFIGLVKGFEEAP